MSPEAFIDYARRYCEWADASAHEPDTVHDILLGLIEGAPRLTDGHRQDRQALGLPRDATWAQQRHFADFPFQSYPPSFWPEVHPEGQFTDDIHEDFAHIHAELRYGLELMERGETASALRYWRDSYFFHWGHHATAAVWAIEWYRNKWGKREPAASPNGGPAERFGSSGTGGGPPSVS